MTASSMIVNYAKTNAVPIVVGASIGFLGHYALTWLKEKFISTFSEGNFHVIHLNQDGFTIKKVSLSEFKAQVSIRNLIELSKKSDGAERDESTWVAILKKSTQVICVKKDNELIGYGNFINNSYFGTIFEKYIYAGDQKEKVENLIVSHFIGNAQLQNQSFSSRCECDDTKKTLSFFYI